MDRGKNKYTCLATQSVRNLPKSQLGAVIFGCRNHTLSECMNKKLFGSPETHYSYVKNIDPGLPLFLFNCSDRKLHGIFKAVSCGQLNIDDQAWAYCERADYTPYAAQVRIDFETKCRPLFEDEFKPIIKSNYYFEKLFWFELDKEQTRALIRLCLSKGLPEKVPRQPKTENTSRPLKEPKLINMFDALSISDTNEAKPDDEFENLDSQKGGDVSYTSVLAISCAQKKWTDFFAGSSSSHQETSNSHAFDRWEDHAHEEDHGPQEVYQNEEFHELVSEGLWLAGGVPLPSSENVNFSDKEGNESDASDSDTQSDMTDGADQGYHSASQYGLFKITQEIESLKFNQLKQGLKVESLERELVHSKLEIQLLKMRCHLLESSMRLSVT